MFTSTKQIIPLLQISGMILDNCARKRTKHVWFSISTDLIVDARRDLEDIGCYVKVMYDFDRCLIE